MDRQAVIDSILQERIIVIVRGVAKEKLVPLAEAMYEGGVRILEITYSADGSTPDGVTAENIRTLASHFEGRMHIGAGTVLTEQQVALTEAAGGEFIISPDTNSAVIAKTREVGLVSIPGALTPSEAQKAHLSGADFVKLFPATSMGPAYVKAIKAPLSHIRFLAVGGVNETNMAEYIASGVSGFGIGSNIVNLKMIERGEFTAITELAREFISALKRSL